VAGNTVQSHIASGILCGMVKSVSAFRWWWMWFPSSLQAGLRLKSVGLVQRSVATWRCSAFIA